MSGHQFPDCEPITLDEWQRLKNKVYRSLNVAGVTAILEVGSTGHSSVMGDIDLALEHPEGRDGVMADLEKGFLTKRVGTDLLSVRWPYGSPRRYVQVDLMVGKISFLEWSRAGSTDPGVKGSARAVLLNAILRYKSDLEFIGTNTELSRQRFALDFGSGLYLIWQTKQGKTRTLKDWKTLRRDKTLDDPAIISQLILGTADFRSTMTLSGVVTALKRYHVFVDHACWILPAYMHELRALDAEMPGDFGNLDVIAGICAC